MPLPPLPLHIPAGSGSVRGKSTVPLTVFPAQLLSLQEKDPIEGEGGRKEGREGRGGEGGEGEAGKEGQGRPEGL